MRPFSSILARVAAVALFFFGAGLFIFGAGLSFTSADEPSEPEVQWEKRTDQRFEKIEPGKPLRVNNPFGNVYARFGGYENEAEILSTIQRIDTDLPELEVLVDHVDGVLDIRVARKATPGGGPTSAARGRDRIDLVFFVPLDSPFDVSTTDGDVEMKGVKSDIKVRTTLGDVRLRDIKGAIHAESDRGTISVSLAGNVTDSPQSFKTVTGDIEILAWEDMDQLVKMATSGEITTDFSIDISYRKMEEPGKYGVANLGKGGPELKMSSKRGRLKLLRLQRNFKPEPAASEGD